jgi:hypothetical protein
MASVASEVMPALDAPSGPVNQAPRLASPPKALVADEERKTRARRRIERLSSAVRPAVEAAEEVVGTSAVVPAEEVAVPQSKAEWVLLVERGEYAAAFQRLEESGGFDAVLESGSSEELMTLVEVARFVGQQGRAIQALRAVTERHQDDPNAPIAAMILGNLLNKSGDPVGAAQAYALNRRLSPGGDFAEDALVGEFDMALAAGDVSRVERLRAKYAAEFPEGRHLESINAEAGRLAARSRPPSAGDITDADDSDSDDSAEEESGETQFERDPGDDQSLD